MLGKRLNSVSKNGVLGRSNVKGKHNSKSSSSRLNRNQSDTNDADNAITIPYIKPTKNADYLPCYHSILNRSTKEDIGMEDLDQLQFDLEKLLTASALRYRYLNNELDYVDRNDDRHDKKIKFLEKPPSPKIRKIDEKAKHVRDIKPFHNKLMKNYQDEIPKPEVPRKKNDIKSKFWSSIDAYCGPVSSDDKRFLDDLIDEIINDCDIKICEKGSHYTEKWLLEQQKQNLNVPLTSSKNTSTQGLFSKKPSYFSSESYPNSVILPLASTLLEENKNSSSQDSLKDMGSDNNKSCAMCLDGRLRSELSDLGLLSDDKQKTNMDQTQGEDEILREIKLCQAELVALNNSNITELNRLRHAVNKSIARQEFINKLDEIDLKIMDVYNKLITTTDDKTTLENEAKKLIEMQSKFHEEVMGLTNVFTD